MAEGEYADKAAQFALQEHALLRQEIIALVEDARTVERNVVVAIGVVWGFLVLHPPLGADRWAWWVPSLFVVMGGIRSWAIHKLFVQFSVYIRRTEALFASTEGVQGWETFLASERRYLIGTSAFFSGLILAATLLVAIYKSFSN